MILTEEEAEKINGILSDLEQTVKGVDIGTNRVMPVPNRIKLARGAYERLNELFNGEKYYG